jgi:hypothetical protein
MVESTQAASSRPPLVIWTALWLLGASIGIWLLWLDITRVHIHTPYGRDFTNLWVAGKLALDGQIGAIFDPEQFRIHFEHWIGVKTFQNYSYPPTALFIAVPFALLPFWPALALWTFGGMAFIVWASRHHVPFSPWLVALSPAALINIWAGHYGFLIGGLWFLFFGCLGTARAGLIAAALTFKPHMGLMIALAALRSRKTLVWAIAGTIALAAASALVFGTEAWSAFFSRTTTEQLKILSRMAHEGYFRMMPSAFVAYGRTPAAAIVQMLFCIAAVLLLIRVKQPDIWIYATATFIVLPYVFNYDMTVVCIGFAVLIYNDGARLSAFEKAIAILAFVSPGLTFLANPLVPFILLAGLWLQVKHLQDADTSSTEWATGQSWTNASQPEPVDSR